MKFYSKFFSFQFGSGSTDRFVRPLESGNNSSNSILQLFGGYGVDKDLKEFVSVSGETEFNLYNTTPELQLVIMRGANLFANGKWLVKDWKTNKIIENHEILHLLENPNPFQTRNEFLIDLYINRALYGNNFTALNFPLKTSDYPATLVNLPPQLIVLKKTGKFIDQTVLTGILKSYDLVDVNDSNKVIRSFDVTEIAQSKIPNPNNTLVGLSPLKSLHMPISNIRAGRGYVNADYTKKGALGALSSDSKDSSGALPLMENDKLDIQRQYSEMTNGIYDEQSKVLISNKPIKWSAFSSAIKDHVIHEEIEIDFKRIIDGFGLNDALFSFQKQSTFSNQSNGEKQAYQNTIIPLGESVAAMFTSKLNLKDKGIYLELDYSHVSAFKEDEEERSKTNKTKAETLKLLVENGVSLDEARVIVGI